MHKHNVEMIKFPSLCHVKDFIAAIFFVCHVLDDDPPVLDKPFCSLVEKRRRKRLQRAASLYGLVNIKE